MLLFYLINHRKLRERSRVTPLYSSSRSWTKSYCFLALSPCGSPSRTDKNTDPACSRRPGLVLPPAGGASQLSPAEVAWFPERDACPGLKKVGSRKMSGRMPLTPVSERESDSVSMLQLLLIPGLLLVLLLMLMNYLMQYLT